MERKKERKGEERKRKGRGKGEERERKGRGKGEKRPCLTQTIFDATNYCFRYRFATVRESCVRFFLLEMAAIIKKGL